MLSVIMLGVAFYLFFGEYRYVECHYAQCLYPEYRNAACRYAECSYAECRGTKTTLRLCVR